MDEFAVSAIVSASRVFREIFFMIDKPLIGFRLGQRKGRGERRVRVNVFRRQSPSLVLHLHVGCGS